MIYGFMQDSPVVESFKRPRETVFSCAENYIVFTNFYERDVPPMSKAQNPKDGKMSKIHFLTPSRSLYQGGVYDTVS